MAVSYAIEGGLLRLTFEGKYAPEDIIREFLAGLADPACPNPVPLLVDVTRSESLATRVPQEIRHVAEYLGPYAGRIGGRCAVVANKDLYFGLSRMGSVYSEGVGVKASVFRDVPAALEWLGHSPSAHDR